MLVKSAATAPMSIAMLAAVFISLLRANLNALPSQSFLWEVAELKKNAPLE